MHQDATWYGGRPQLRNFVSDGHQAPSPNRGRSPPEKNFRPMFIVATRLDGSRWQLAWSLVGLSPDDFVLDGDPAPPQKGGGTPTLQFSAHFYCGQTAGCIKMPLGMEVGISPVDCVRWGPISPPKKGADPNIFDPCLLRPNGCMDQDTTWYGGRPLPRRHCVRWGPSSPPQKGGRAPSPIFGPCLLWPNSWMDQDGTWHGGWPWSRPHCARWEPAPLSKKGAQPPIFGPFLQRAAMLALQALC